MYSRTLDRVTEFPELGGIASQSAGDFILDGEIIGWRDGRAIPFTELQQRLGRKQIDLFTSTLVPVSFVAFDLLLLNGESLLDLELAERRLRMTNLLTPHERPELQFTRADLCTTVEEIEAAFVSALAKGNEGLVAKGPQSPYVPGRRGQYWIKLKRPLATLDVVVTRAEYGHGKRRGLLSDYTFAVRDTDSGEGPGRLVNIGKAYSGVTDAEIAQLTKFFLEHTIEDHGHVRDVEPVDRDGNRLQQHSEIQPPRLRIRAAVSAHRAAARRQTCRAISIRCHACVKFSPASRPVGHAQKIRKLDCPHEQAAIVIAIRAAIGGVSSSTRATSPVRVYRSEQSTGTVSFREK